MDGGDFFQETGRYKYNTKDYMYDYDYCNYNYFDYDYTRSSLVDRKCINRSEKPDQPLPDKYAHCSRKRSKSQEYRPHGLREENLPKQKNKRRLQSSKYASPRGDSKSYLSTGSDGVKVLFTRQTNKTHKHPENHNNYPYDDILRNTKASLQKIYRKNQTKYFQKSKYPNRYQVPKSFPMVHDKIKYEINPESSRASFTKASNKNESAIKSIVFSSASPTQTVTSPKLIKIAKDSDDIITGRSAKPLSSGPGKHSNKSAFFCHSVWSNFYVLLKYILVGLLALVWSPCIISSYLGALLVDLTFKPNNGSVQNLSNSLIKRIYHLLILNSTRSQQIIIKEDKSANTRRKSKSRKVKIFGRKGVKKGRKRTIFKKASQRNIPRKDMPAELKTYCEQGKHNDEKQLNTLYTSINRKEIKCNDNGKNQMSNKTLHKVNPNKSSSKFTTGLKRIQVYNVKTCYDRDRELIDTGSCSYSHKKSLKRKRTSIYKFCTGLRKPIVIPMICETNHISGNEKEIQDGKGKKRIKGAKVREWTRGGQRIRVGEGRDEKEARGKKIIGGKEERGRKTAKKGKKEEGKEVKKGKEVRETKEVRKENDTPVDKRQKRGYGGKIKRWAQSKKDDYDYHDANLKKAQRNNRNTKNKSKINKRGKSENMVEDERSRNSQSYDSYDDDYNSGRNKKITKIKNTKKRSTKRYDDDYDDNGGRIKSTGKGRDKKRRRSDRYDDSDGDYRSKSISKNRNSRFDNNKRRKIEGDYSDSDRDRKENKGRIKDGSRRVERRNIRDSVSYNRYDQDNRGGRNVRRDRNISQRRRHELGGGDTRLIGDYGYACGRISADTYKRRRPREHISNLLPQLFDVLKSLWHGCLYAMAVAVWIPCLMCMYGCCQFLCRFF